MKNGRYKNQNVAVLGAGLSGSAAALLLASEGAQVTVLDSAEDRSLLRSTLDNLRAHGVRVIHGSAADEDSSEYQWIVWSPGIDPASPLGRNFCSRKVEMISELELGWRFCEVPVIAVTGTNGKTTTSFLTDAILRSAGEITALIGTIEYRLAGETRTAVNTTPESLDLYRMFAELESRRGTHVTMEVSSHALALGRVYGVSFHTAVFTNLTRDHLDFHGTMEDYFAAKRNLFEPAESTAPVRAIINHDDAYGRQIKLSPDTRLLSYGFEAGADLRATALQVGFEGLRFTVEHGGGKRALTSPLVGRFNCYNILAACGVALSYGIDWDLIASGIAQCRAVPGPAR